MAYSETLETGIWFPCNRKISALAIPAQTDLERCCQQGHKAKCSGIPEQRSSQEFGNPN